MAQGRGEGKPSELRSDAMDGLGFLVFVLVWVFLQAWLLPRLGVPT